MARKKKIRKDRVFIAVLFFLIFVGLITFAILLYSSAEPPISTFNQCQADISRAREVEAEKYAPLILVSAESSCQLAMNEWKYQNDRLFFLRDYTKMLNLSLEASTKAREATDVALHIKDSLESDLSTQLKAVGYKLDHFDANYSRLPLSGTTRQNFTSAKMKYMESKAAFERGDYKNVGVNLDVASQLITKSVNEAHNYLSDYFRDLPKWKRWASETIDWSDQHNAAVIVIDKFAHKCYVYQNGRLKKEFIAELGPKWIGNKQYNGDKATPEGQYHITKKKSNRSTKYYKALLINYPNDEDKARYEANVKKGRIPRRGVGSLIEIHGDGGKGINWTDGCIALTNDDIDKLFNLVIIGTPVTIVGSLRSLKQINGF